MKDSDLVISVRQSKPFALGYSTGFASGALPIIGVCLHCEKGGVICAKDNVGLSKALVSKKWKDTHKDCIGKFPMDYFTHNGKPRKLLENEITTVSFADEEAEAEGAPLPLEPAGGCGAPVAQGGPELPEEILRALRKSSGYDTDDECEETVLELIENVLESKQMWHDRYYALLEAKGR